MQLEISFFLEFKGGNSNIIILKFSMVVIVGWNFKLLGHSVGSCVLVGVKAVRGVWPTNLGWIGNYGTLTCQWYAVVHVSCGLCKAPESSVWKCNRGYLGKKSW